MQEVLGNSRNCISRHDMKFVTKSHLSFCDSVIPRGKILLVLLFYSSHQASTHSGSKCKHKTSCRSIRLRDIKLSLCFSSTFNKYNTPGQPFKVCRNHGGVWSACSWNWPNIVRRRWFYSFHQIKTIRYSRYRKITRKAPIAVVIAISLPDAWTRLASFNAEL